MLFRIKARHSFIWGSSDGQMYLSCVLSCIQLFEVPWTVAHEAPLPGNFLDKNTGVGCHFLLQGIFPTQGWNLHFLHLLHWQMDCLPLEKDMPLIIRAVTWLYYIIQHKFETRNVTTDKEDHS